jgi:dienelactone hydrolase
MTNPAGLWALAALVALEVGLCACVAGERKQPDELPSVNELPNPFVRTDGSTVERREDWPARREELTELVFAYEYGHLPPAAPVSASERPWKPAGKQAQEAEAGRAADAVPLPPGTTEKHLLLTTGPGGRGVEIPVVLTMPAGEGPFPAIIRGDLCWGRVDSRIAAEVAARGYILAEFDRTAIVPDEKGTRDVGLYRLYPDQDFGALAAWAWGFHRVADYLLTRDDVRPDQLTVTGHSRGGKCALLAGATDERIALTVPNNSGCGGAGCYRFQADKSEDIAAITKNFPHWFHPDFPQFIGKIDRLPIDQHSVKALVAPRALLSTEALGDLWANPEGTQQSHLAAREVYAFLGAPEKIAVVYREGDHEHNLADWRVLLDFADVQFKGKQPPRRFDDLHFPTSKKAFSWTAPAAGK